MIPDSIRKLYPFDGKYADVGGARMHYVDEGDGPPVIMLHGNPTWSFYYRNLILALRDRHRVIAPDHIGCGLSDKPQDYNYRLQQHVDNVSTLIDRLELDRVNLVVHDWGGAIGMGWAVRNPQRVERMVILNTSAFFGPVPWRIAVCRWPIVGAIAVRGLNGFLRASFHMGVADRANMPLDVCRGYLLPYRNRADRVAIHRFVQDIPTNQRHPTHALIRSIDAGLATLRDKPAMICWGMRDFCFTPWFLEQWQQRLPNAVVHQFPDASHYLLEEMGNAGLARIAGFLGPSE